MLFPRGEGRVSGVSSPAYGGAKSIIEIAISLGMISKAYRCDGKGDDHMPGAQSGEGRQPKPTPRWGADAGAEAGIKAPDRQQRLSFPYFAAMGH
jgi:hypothetical protein